MSRKRKNCYDLMEAETEEYRAAQISPKMMVTFHPDFDAADGEIRQIVILRENLNEIGQIDDENPGVIEAISDEKMDKLHPLDESMFPEDSTKSQILSKEMIQQLLEILPVSAQGYPWIEIYSSFEGEYPNFGKLHRYKPTGQNYFFINATKEALSFGASNGHFGLWVDEDLNKGRTQKCDTFNNEPLVDGQSEDYIVQAIETYNFSLA
uniref:Oxidation resistance protein 1 n=1 Tax=Acrobeloides nanus TaxID=290746 RepID=A0A914CQM5_9BILA